MRGFSVRLNFLFILAVPCQISYQLAATNHREHEGTIASRSKGSNPHPQIPRITVDARRGASHQNNPARRQHAGANTPPWADAGNGRSYADGASHFLYLVLGRRPRHDRLPSRQRPTIVVATHHRPSSRTTQPVQRPVSNINSGVLLRLKGNSIMNEGLVQVFVNNKWGYICHDDQWGAADAKVVCQQLGFTSTAANSLWTSWIGTREPFVMNSVVCTGSESKIQDCIYRQNPTCSSRRPARVYCALNSGCQSGWVSGNGFCYKLVTSAESFEESEATCRSLDAYLVKIETQMENNFLSSMLTAERAEGTIWTSGRLTDSNNQVAWRWLGASHAVRFTKWFPGWRTRQQNNAVNDSCIALSKAFPGSNEANSEVDYYFWKSLPCTQILPFVCKKVVQTSDCYEGNGAKYRGTAFATTRASLCQKWTESKRINPVTHPNLGLGDHNYCRNPDGDERPWCWVDTDQTRYGYCELSACSGKVSSMSTSPSTNSPIAADCGRRPIHQPHAKVVGGQFATYGAYPWQARIYKRHFMNEYIHSCGGTIIAQNWILSAAHCFEHTLTANVRVRVGDHRSTAYDPSEQDFAVEQVFPHPSYSNTISMVHGSARYDNDIALVKLHPNDAHPEISFNSHVQPACLPSPSVNYTSGLICEVSGWGLSGRSIPPPVLMYAVIPLIKFDVCQSLYNNKLSEKMFCAGYRDGRADTCQGDSGGPLVCNINGTYKIMGITSWGMGCGIRDSPGVYTKVGEFFKWIQETVDLHS